MGLGARAGLGAGTRGLVPEFPVPSSQFTETCPSPRSRVPSPESPVPSPESRVPRRPESPVPSPESRVVRECRSPVSRGPPLTPEGVTTNKKAGNSTRTDVRRALQSIIDKRKGGRSDCVHHPAALFDHGRRTQPPLRTARPRPDPVRHTHRHGHRSHQGSRARRHRRRHQSEHQRRHRAGDDGGRSVHGTVSAGRDLHRGGHAPGLRRVPPDGHRPRHRGDGQGRRGAQGQSGWRVGRSDGGGAAAADRPDQCVGRDRRRNDRRAPQRDAESARLCLPAGRSGAAQRDERHPGTELVRHRRRRPARLVGGRRQRRPRLHQRHPAGWPAGHGRRLQRGVGGAQHGRAAGGARHLQQFQRRVRPRPVRDRDEHEVGHERVSRPGRLHDAARGAGRELVLEQRPGHSEARVPGQ